MKVIGASWDLRMARFRWTDAPIELRFRVIDRNPHFTQGKFFFRSIFISDCWVSGKSVFWLFLRQKMEKVPIFWARSNCTSESYFVLKFQKHRTIFGHFLLLGTFGALLALFGRFWPKMATLGPRHGSFIIIDEWMYVCISVLVDSCPFSFVWIFFLSSTFSTVINFFNPRFYTYSFCL